IDDPRGMDDRCRLPGAKGHPMPAIAGELDLQIPHRCDDLAPRICATPACNLCLQTVAVDLIAGDVRVLPDVGLGVVLDPVAGGPFGPPTEAQVVLHEVLVHEVDLEVEDPAEVVPSHL